MSLPKKQVDSIPLQTTGLPLHAPLARQNRLFFPIREYALLQMKSALPPIVVFVSLIFFPCTGSGRLPQSTTNKEKNYHLRREY